MKVRCPIEIITNASWITRTEWKKPINDISCWRKVRDLSSSVQWRIYQDKMFNFSVVHISDYLNFTAKSVTWSCCQLPVIINMWDLLTNQEDVGLNQVSSGQAQIYHSQNHHHCSSSFRKKKNTPNYWFLLHCSAAHLMAREGIAADQPNCPNIGEPAGDSCPILRNCCFRLSL